MTDGYGDRIRSITGVILAGGENRRFPTLKAFINLDGSTIIEKNLALLKSLFNDNLISTNMPEEYFHLGERMIGDVLPSKGPMSGIYSCLVNAAGGSVFVTACDMPFLKKELVSYICNRHEDLSAFKNFDATVPVFNGKPQPLLAIYRKSLLRLLEERILSEKTSLRFLLDDIKTNLIDEAEIRKIDPDGKSFVNINTVEDYGRVLGPAD